MSGFHFLAFSSSIMKGGRSPRSGHGADTAAKAMEEHYLLACSPGFAQSAFLYNPGSPAQGWHCPEQAGLPISIIDQDCS
jgi:hypothetical protein